MRFEQYGLGRRLGADMWTSGGRSSNTHVVCDTAHGRDYSVAVINREGAVQSKDDGRFKRVDIRNLGPNGVEVFRGPNNSHVVEPGKTLTIPVGEHEVEIRGTEEDEIILNGTPSLPLAEKFAEKRYPRED